MTPATWWLGRMTGVLAALALVFGASALLGDKNSQGQRAIRNYTASLDQQLRFIRSAVRGSHILIGQATLSLGIAGYALWQK